MTTTYLFTRKHNGENYKFYLNSPTYDGETGVCGIEIEPYISVKTEENCFGYEDTILMNNGYAYSLYRYINNNILEKIAKQMTKALKKYA